MPTVAAAAGLALAGWLAIAALAPLTPSYAGPLLVIAPNIPTERLLAAGDTRLLDASGALVRVIDEEPGAAARLYAAGAWLVVPGRRSGCFTR